MRVIKKNAFVFGVLIIIIMANVAACFDGFCQFYRQHIYRYVADGLGYITACIPIAIGELFMYIGIICGVTDVILMVLLIFMHKKESFKIILKRIFKVEAITIVVFLFIYTFNWIIPLRCKGIEFSSKGNGNYKLEEIQELRLKLLNNMEMYANECERDKNGKLIFNDDIEEKTKKAINKFSENYPLFKGYIPPMKKAMCSDFLDFMNIGGFTYPFTMEITCSKYITSFYYPVLYSHEVSHHKGYYREDEAEFFSYLILMECDDTLLKYAGYHDAFCWIDNAYYDTLIGEYGEAIGEEIYYNEQQPSDLIYRDEQNDNEEYEEKYEQEVNKTLEASKEYVEEVGEVGWDVQAQLLKEANYDGVVRLLLEWNRLYELSES